MEATTAAHAASVSTAAAYVHAATSSAAAPLLGEDRGCNR
jgi:hypothetical protein